MNKKNILKMFGSSLFFLIILLGVVVSSTGCMVAIDDSADKEFIKNLDGSNLDKYLVVRVVDGDTVKVDIDGTIETLRLIGIDTPESVHPTKPIECFGVAASNKAKSILNGKKVFLEADKAQGDKDKYGRLLRYIFLEDGTNFNKLMIDEGYAYEHTHIVPYKYQSDFKQAQIDAEKNKKGLWADSACK